MLHDTHAEIFYSHTGYDITSYLIPIDIHRSSENGRKCRFRRRLAEFWWRGVLPTPPVGGLIVVLSMEAYGNSGKNLYGD